MNEKHFCTLHHKPDCPECNPPKDFEFSKVMAERVQGRMKKFTLIMCEEGKCPLWEKCDDSPCNEAQMIQTLREVARELRERANDTQAFGEKSLLRGAFVLRAMALKEMADEIERGINGV